MSVRKSGELKSLSDFLLDLPTPSMINYMWSGGSLLGLFLGIQIVSGVFLAIHYSCDSVISFDSLVHTMRDVYVGWVSRVVHSNGASLFFMLMYFHIGRGFYMGSYRFFRVWLSGSMIFLVSMGTAFLGYVLPWGQMSFWAATVITNLLSALPYFGSMMVEWVWGGFSVGNATLTRFFTFHFLFPFVVFLLVLFHLVFLHDKGSSGVFMGSNLEDKVSFHPYFSVSDMLGVFVLLFMLLFVVCETPFIFMDTENFICANSLVTPVHIQPEWYFLFAYAILRSIPSKIGGVVALLMSVLVLFFVPYLFKGRVMGVSSFFFSKFFYWFYINILFMLTWAGAQEVDFPYDLVSVVFMVLYFIYYVLMFLLVRFNEEVYF